MGIEVELKLGTCDQMKNCNLNVKNIFKNKKLI